MCISNTRKRKYVRFEISKDDLIKEYSAIGNCEKIGEKYGVSETTVRDKMKVFQIPYRKTWSRGGHNLLPIIGQRFGKLVVIEKQGREKSDNGEAKWICKCDCGNTYVTGSNRLRRGATKSCGCFKIEKLTPNRYQDLSHAYWSRIVRGAQIRGLSLEIIPKDAWDKFVEQGKKCALSGVELVLSNPYSGKNQTASFDRIDSSKGYEKSNIQWIHKDLNNMKNNFTDAEFILWCEKVSNYVKLKKVNG